MMRYRLGLMAALAFGAALTASPQGARADGPVAVSIVSVNDSQFPTVTAVVSVQVDGRPAGTLRREDITVEEEGRNAPVASVTRATDASLPLAVVLAIDTSGSMSGANIEQAKAAASVLIANLAPADAAAIVSFADRVQLKLDLSLDHLVLAKTVAGLQAGGNTALFDAVVESSRVASAASVPRKVVILLSDGEDFGGLSKATREQSLERAAGSGALFFVIGVGREVDQVYLQALADRTGGRYIAAAAAADVPAGYQAIAELLKGQFVVSVESAAPAEPRQRTLSVTVRSGTASATARVAYLTARPLFIPAADPQPQPATVEARATAEVTSTAAEASDDGIDSRLIFLVLAGIALIAGAAGWRYWPRPHPEPGRDARTFDAGHEEPEPRPRPRAGALRLRTAKIGRAPGKLMPLPLEPTAVGSGSICQIRLPAADGVAQLHARIWIREGKPMLHHLDPATTTTVNGNKVDWLTLSPGDVIGIGPYQLEYLSRLQAAEAATNLSPFEGRLKSLRIEPADERP